MVLHLYLFHVLQTTSMHTLDLDVGVPARGWHGEAYRGHIFWDELFVFPLLNLRLHEITRTLLRYRYRRLHEARVNARNPATSGRCFPGKAAAAGVRKARKFTSTPSPNVGFPMTPTSNIMSIRPSPIMFTIIFR